MQGIISNDIPSCYTCGLLHARRPALWQPSIKHAAHRTHAAGRMGVWKSDSHGSYTSWKDHGCKHRDRRSLAVTAVGGGRGSGATAKGVVSTVGGRAPARNENKEPLLVLEDVAKSHDGDTQLFKDVSFTVCRGDRLAVVGTNGSGKTTLLRIMAGAAEADAGEVKRIDGVRVGFLEQDPQMDPNATVLEAVLSSDAEAAKALQYYERVLSGTQAGTSTSEELNEAHGRVDHYDAWALDTEARAVLEELGCEDVHARISGLSGGQRRRAALAAALLSKPDLLILDEPTNHLDLQAIRWAEERLTARDSSLVLVTHDRSFLEALATGILELDRDGAHMHAFGGRGCYQRFREARVARRRAAAEAAADARTLLRKESVWMSKQPKARETKSRKRQENYFELLSKSRSGPPRDMMVDFGGGASLMSRQGKKVLRMEGCSAVVGDREIIREFWYDFEPGERIGIVGPNGTGKSTLLKMLAGHLPLAGGERSVGDTTVTGFFTQDPIDMRATASILGWIRDEVEVAAATEETAGPTLSPETLLERLGFPRSQQMREVGMLSGGQRRRLQLAGVLRRRPNLLLLDEPTNDLDLNTIEAVEGLLAEYKGVLLVVSHDRSFLDATTNRLFVLQGDGHVRLFDGSYREYLDIVAKDEKQRRKEAAKQRTVLGESSQAAGAAASAQQNGSSGSAQTAVAEKPKLRLSFREKQDLERLEREVEEMSAQKEELEAAIAAHSSSGDFEALTAATQQLAKLTAAIDSKTDRWMELAERADS